jgi:sorbitol-specific phosphotransferase system component IIC
MDYFQNTERKYDIVPPMIRHPILEDIFLFSGELKVGANTSLESMEKISRYVVFITHTLYLLDDGDKAGEYDFARFFQEKQKPYSSIYFQDTSSEIPIWGVYSVQFFGRL